MAKLYQYPAKQAPTFTPAEAVPDYGWFQPANEPVRTKRGLYLSVIVNVCQIETGPATGLVSGGDSIVIQALKHFQYQAYAQPVFFEPAAAEEITLDKWFVPWTEPPKGRVNRAHLWAVPFDDVNIWPAGVVETVTLDKWYMPFSEPVRTRRNFYWFTGPVDDVSIWPAQFVSPPPPKFPRRFVTGIFSQMR